MATRLWTVNTAQMFVKVLTDIRYKHYMFMATIKFYKHAKILQA